MGRAYTRTSPGRVRCSICGYWLTAKRSVERGIGPQCWDELSREAQADYLVERARAQYKEATGQ